METLKSLFYIIFLMVYFKAAFAMGFGLLWSGGALILLALLWAGMKKLFGSSRSNADTAE